ncbi:MAG: hydroxylamine reductase [Candidatus Eisenbacteria bacterium]|nr:hydroxylamine reductase [Candidatus Eisenbacteria bacterium]
MYCHQCEQTAKGIACTVRGVCGKDDDTATLQDLLIYATKGVSMYANRARALGASDHDVDVFVVQALFTTITNVNFDPARIESVIRRAADMKDRAGELYRKAAVDKGQTPDEPGGPAAWKPAKDMAGLLEQGRSVTIEMWADRYGEDNASLREVVLYGLKGAAAYTDHAQILGREDEKHYASFHEVLDALTRDELSNDELLAMALRTGEINLRAMELLDEANTGAYGHPAPTEVRVTPVKGKAIVVSGHDLKDLKALLEQTEGTGINVYTHGEMLPAHGYPELNKHEHLVGNYGGAWQDQYKEFDAFPGAILMTTNCIQRPADTYKRRIFTTGLVAWPGVEHVEGPDFQPVIDAALAAPGFQEDGEEQHITVGFGHNAVLNVAGDVVDAVKAGKIKHFFLVGGCDGAKSGRNYYTELAEKIPEDSVILTLACGKYRFNKKDLGQIGGLPRLMDVGQCNDSYSAVKIALALSEAFGVEVNDLPLSLVLSWYEQKAVAILLTLLHLGIKNIRLGPTLPACVTPNVLKLLVDAYGIKPIGTVEEDLKEMVGAPAN